MKVHRIVEQRQILAAVLMVVGIGGLAYAVAEFGHPLRATILFLATSAAAAFLGRQRVNPDALERIAELPSSAKVDRLPMTIARQIPLGVLGAATIAGFAVWQPSVVPIAAGFWMGWGLECLQGAVALRRVEKREDELLVVGRPRFPYYRVSHPPIFALKRDLQRTRIAQGQRA